MHLLLFPSRRDDLSNCGTALLLSDVIQVFRGHELVWLDLSLQHLSKGMSI